MLLNNLFHVGKQDLQHDPNCRTGITHRERQQTLIRIFLFGVFLKFLIINLDQFQNQKYLLVLFCKDLKPPQQEGTSVSSVGVGTYISVTSLSYAIGIFEVFYHLKPHINKSRIKSLFRQISYSYFYKKSNVTCPYTSTSF